MNAPRIYPFGENALVCEAPQPATLDVQRRVWTLADAARTWPGVHEVVPGMNNLTVIFDALATDARALAPRLNDAWRRADGAPTLGRDVEIPVVYGGADGPDLEDVARHAGLTPDEVVQRHTAGRYVVFFLGFKPGFAYLGGLDPALHTPRRAQPRLTVPAGAVGIGGAQTGIYPAASPGGWQLIGRTRLALFDPARTPPTLLLPGDRVRFTVATAEGVKEAADKERATGEPEATEQTAKARAAKALVARVPVTNGFAAQEAPAAAGSFANESAAKAQAAKAPAAIEPVTKAFAGKTQAAKEPAATEPFFANGLAAQAQAAKEPDSTVQAAKKPVTKEAT